MGKRERGRGRGGRRGREGPGGRERGRGRGGDSRERRPISAGNRPPLAVLKCSRGLGPARRQGCRGRGGDRTAAGGRHPKLVHWRRAGPALHPDRCDDQPADQALLSTRTAQPADGRRVGLVLQHVRSSTLSFARSLHRSLFSANLRLAFARLLAHSGTRLLQVAHLLPP